MRSPSNQRNFAPVTLADLISAHVEAMSLHLEAIAWRCRRPTGPRMKGGCGPRSDYVVTSLGERCVIYR